LVKTGNGWQFDSEAGREEVLARRIGGNELGVISLCRDYVKAQKEYASEPHDARNRRPVPLNAFGVRPVSMMAFFWRLNAGKGAAPFGELVAAATAEGYDPGKPDSSPFRGYRFRILTAQGPAASERPQRSYVVNGDMTGGFALVAWPAKYASSSGVMTFVVGPDGGRLPKKISARTPTCRRPVNGVQP